MPAFSWSITDFAWLSEGRVPTKGESWVPTCETFEYIRPQSSAWPLHRVSAEAAETRVERSKTGLIKERMMIVWTLERAAIKTTLTVG